MPCKKGTKKHFPFQETEAKRCESNKIPETKHAHIMEAHESTRKCLESSLPKDHEDHIAGKGNEFDDSVNLVHKFIPMPQMIKILFAKAAVDKEWKQRETIPAWQLDKVKSKKRGCSRSTKRQKESPLCHNEGHLSSQKMRS